MKREILQLPVTWLKPMGVWKCLGKLVFSVCIVLLVLQIAECPVFLPVKHIVMKLTLKDSGIGMRWVYK